MKLKQSTIYIYEKKKGHAGKEYLSHEFEGIASSNYKS